MPFPILICLALISGLLSALAARVDLKVNPRHPLLTPSFGAYVLYLLFVFLPSGAYYYVFHGDWFLLYLLDVRYIPSALALVGFIVVASLGVLSFWVGALMVRSARESSVVALSFVSLMLGIVCCIFARNRLSVVGTRIQFEGDLGLDPFWESTVSRGTFSLGLVLIIGFVFLCYRLYRSGQRGG